jgi:hypothetical protein
MTMPHLEELAATVVATAAVYLSVYAAERVVDWWHRTVGRWRRPAG